MVNKKQMNRQGCGGTRLKNIQLFFRFSVTFLKIFVSSEGYDAVTSGESALYANIILKKGVVT